MIVTAQQNDTVDALCHRYYGATQGMSELVFEANQGLAAQGMILPIGHQVFLPEAPAAAANQSMTQLWD